MPRSGGGSSRPAQASARLASSRARSGGATAKPSTCQPPPVFASKALTAPQAVPSAAAAASAAPASATTAATRQTPAAL
ncbi:MAG TPA: hypothetical protein VEI03_20135 [Stellaceae bacterium]|nr:hypothetical protein [Stellaceae bacterium]